MPIGPWLSVDPRELEWYCNKCERDNYTGMECFNCKQPRVLDQEEIAEIKECEESGKRLCGAVLAVEVKDPKKVDAITESLREWFHFRTQTISIKGTTKYVLLSLEGIDHPEDIESLRKHPNGINSLLNNSKRYQVHTFPEKIPLDEITEQLKERNCVKKALQAVTVKDAEY